MNLYKKRKKKKKLIDETWRETTTGRILVPQEAQQLVMVQAHNAEAGHRGVGATIAMIKKHFVWDSLVDDVTDFVKTCVHCAINNGPSRVFLPHGTIRQGRKFNDVVHLDHVQMTATAEGFEWILLIVDDYTKLTVLVPVQTTTHMAMWDALVHSWMQYFGAPKSFISDNGPAFAAQRFRDECKHLGTHVHLTTPNVPQTHGVVERTARYMRETCDKILSEKQWTRNNWTEVLPTVQGALNQTPTDRLGGHSPIELAFGMDPIDPVARLRNHLDPTEPFGRDIEEHLEWLRGRVAEWCLEATTAREARNKRTKARRAKIAGMETPPIFPPGTFVLLSGGDAKGLRSGPVWSSIAQVVRQQSQYRYLVQDVFAPFKRTTRHACAFSSRLDSTCRPSYDAFSRPLRRRNKSSRDSWIWSSTFSSSGVISTNQLGKTSAPSRPTQGPDSTRTFERGSGPTRRTRWSRVFIKSTKDYGGSATYGGRGGMLPNRPPGR